MYTTTCNMNIDYDMFPDKCNKLIYNYNNKTNCDGLFLEWEVYVKAGKRGGGQGGQNTWGPDWLAGPKSW